MRRSEEWVKGAVDDDEVMSKQENRDYLDHMTAVTWAMLYDKRAGFTRMAKEHEHDFAQFGGSVSTINLNRNYDGFTYRNWHMRDTAFALNDDGEVDRLSRKIKTTARNCKRQFEDAPHATVPPKIQEIYRDTPDADVKLLHMAIPRDMYTETRPLPKNARFVSVYLSAEEGDVIQELPEFEFPYMVSRWRTVSGWGAYPFSPATMAALPLSRGLQSIMQTFIEAGEKQVDPPLVATTEAISSPIDITSGGVTWVDSEYDERMGDPLRALDLGKNVRLGENMLMTFHRLMAEAMYISKLNMPDAAGEGTAYEMSQLIMQNIRQLQPIFEPAQDEIPYRYLDRVVSTGMRLGAYGPLEDVPRDLRGHDITYTFFNPLQAERDRKRAAQFQEAAGIAEVAMGIDPSLLVEMNPIQWVRDAMRGIGAPADWLLPEQAAMQQRMAALAEQQQQIEMQSAGQMAQIIEHGGKGVNEIAQAEAAANAA